MSGLDVVIITVIVCIGTVASSRYMIMAPQIFLSGVGTKPVRQAESGIWWPSSTRRRKIFLSDDHGIA